MYGNVVMLIRELYCFFLFLLLPELILAQLLVDNNVPYNTPQYLVQDVLFGGVIPVNNVQYTGSANALGYFDGVSSNKGINSGVVFSTGTF